MFTPVTWNGVNGRMLSVLSPVPAAWLLQVFFDSVLKIADKTRAASFEFTFDATIRELLCESSPGPGTINSSNVLKPSPNYGGFGRSTVDLMKPALVRTRYCICSTVLLHIIASNKFIIVVNVCHIKASELASISAAAAAAAAAAKVWLWWGWFIFIRYVWPSLDMLNQLDTLCWHVECHVHETCEPLDRGTNNFCHTRHSYHFEWILATWPNYHSNGPWVGQYQPDSQSWPFTVMIWPSGEDSFERVECHVHETCEPLNRGTNNFCHTRHSYSYHFEWILATRPNHHWNGPWVGRGFIRSLI